MFHVPHWRIPGSGSEVAEDLRPDPDLQPLMLSLRSARPERYLPARRSPGSVGSGVSLPKRTRLSPVGVRLGYFDRVRLHVSSLTFLQLLGVDDHACDNLALCRRDHLAIAGTSSTLSATGIDRTLQSDHITGNEAQQILGQEPHFGPVDADFHVSDQKSVT